MSTHNDVPQQRQTVLALGVPLEQARAAMLLLHGRGATAEDIASLVPAIDQGAFCYLAPQAAANSWYPYSFLAPISQNEPALSSALNVIGALLDHIAAAGIPPERTMLLGFSQGACLTLEFAARNARRYGGLVGLSGGLIGPDGTPRDYPGSLDGTPVFLGCSEVDFHIPKQRVLDSAVWLRQLGGSVTERLYPHMGHSINADEIEQVRTMMTALLE